MLFVCINRIFMKEIQKKRSIPIAKPTSCALINIVVPKGGPKATTESFHAIMRSQQQVGAHSNKTLTRRMKLMWCFSSFKLCDKTICKSVKLYMEGDYVIRKHRSNIFTSVQAKTYISKVVDCVDLFLIHYLFLASSLKNSHNYSMNKYEEVHHFGST